MTITVEQAYTGDADYSVGPPYHVDVAFTDNVTAGNLIVVFANGSGDGTGGEALEADDFSTSGTATLDAALAIQFQGSVDMGGLNWVEYIGVAIATVNTGGTLTIDFSPNWSSSQQGINVYELSTDTSWPATLGDVVEDNEIESDATDNVTAQTCGAVTVAGLSLGITGIMTASLDTGASTSADSPWTGGPAFEHTGAGAYITSKTAYHALDNETLDGDWTLDTAASWGYIGFTAAFTDNPYPVPQIMQQV